MKDIVLLSVGDTTIPFAEYEGDTAAYCRGIKDAFGYLGIDSDVSEAVCKSMAGKQQLVQKVFLLRVVGMKQRDIADLVHTNQQEVSRCIRHKCQDIRRILREYVKPQPYEPFDDVEVPASLRN